jgi:6-phosphogluconolactonase
MKPHDRNVELEVFDDLEALSRAAARMFVTTAESAIAASGRFTVALAGGGTPRRTYELLAEPRTREKVRWEVVHVFWGDERCVPPDDPRSNARMARQALLDRVPLPKENIHPILSMDDPRESAADYEAVLRTSFRETLPGFDLIFLGMGEDGHTASLFPGSPALDEIRGWVAAVPSKDPPRVTLTYPVLNNALIVAFLVSGENKAEALQRVLEGSPAQDSLPAARIWPLNGTIHFLVDRAAASKLSAVRWQS